MNFNNVFLKSFRVVLLPFALLYGGIVIVRNWLYNKRYLGSVNFNFPLIGVGNLAVGGTGKSPMVEYLINLLHPQFQVATLSRGYKRKTKGYALANPQTTALEIGDEPMQFHSKFPEVSVSVGEQRLEAIPQLLFDRPDLDVIILDDAFQHRSVNAGFNILLTEFANLYANDFFLPTGDLRDQKASAKRANVIVVTKCPADLSAEKKQHIITQVKPMSYQHIFFTTIAYGIPYHIHSKVARAITQHDEILLVCGIANPKPLKELLLKTALTYHQKNYNDHHIFSIDDLKEIKQLFEAIDAKEKFILTTEKDAVRLMKFTDALEHLPIYVLPIKHQFLFNEGDIFNELVIRYITTFSLNNNNT